MKVRVTLQEFKRAFHEVVPTLMNHPHPETFAYRTVELEAEPVEYLEFEHDPLEDSKGWARVNEYKPKCKEKIEEPKVCEHEMELTLDHPVGFKCKNCGVRPLKPIVLDPVEEPEDCESEKCERLHDFEISEKSPYSQLTYKLNQEFDNIYALIRKVRK